MVVGMWCEQSARDGDGRETGAVHMRMVEQFLGETSAAVVAVEGGAEWRLKF